MVDTVLHSALTTSNNHNPFSLSYATQAARLADTSLVTADLYKFAFQVADDTMWCLLTVTPNTWAAVAAGSSGITSASNVGSGSDVYKQKTGSDLEFNGIKSETNRITVALDGVSNDIEFTLVEGNVVHQNLSGAGSQTHAQIDTAVTNSIAHISATAAHGATGAVVGTTNTQTLAAKTLTTPTIASFTNATHDHADAAGGGTIAHSATTGQTANDHHDQSHTHASHTGIGTDDHHAQTHTIVSHDTTATGANLNTLIGSGSTTLHYHSADRARAVHTGTQTASTISDFDTEVSNNASVALNTTHRSSDGKNHSDVVLNNTHRASDGKNHSDVVLNNTHRGSTGADHTYLDQSVVIGSSPSFGTPTISSFASATHDHSNAAGGGTIPAVVANTEHATGDSGMAYDKPSFTIVDASGLKLDVEKVGTGDMRFYVNGSESTLDCTTGAGAGGKARVALTAGVDENNPVTNYIYVTNSGGTATLTASTALPTGAFGWVGKIIVPDATTWAITSAYGYQRYTEALINDSRGIHSHTREKVRALGAVYINGFAQTLNITVNGGAADNVHLATTTGQVYQLHRQTMPAFTTGPYYYGNGPNIYERITDLNDVLQEVDTTSLSGKRFNLVIWGAVNYSTGDCKLFVNQPTGSYTNSSQARNDRDNTADYTVPDDMRSVAFMVSRVALRHTTTSSGTWTELGLYSLLGTPAGARSGGAGAVASNEYADTVFRIYDDGDDSKKIAFEASGITTSTVRTITMPDANVNLGDIATNTTAIGLNTTHRTSNGSDHSYLDQSVVSGSNPTFGTPTISSFASATHNHSDAANGGILSVSMDSTYNAGASIAVDAYDVIWTTTGAYSHVFNIAGCTSSADGFMVINGGDSFSLKRNATDVIYLTAALGTIDIDTSGSIRIDSGTLISIDAITTIDWSGTNAALTSAGALSLASNLTLTGGGSIVSTSNGNIDLIPNGTGITTIGGGTGSHSLNAPGDLFVSGKLEVDGSLYADTGIVVGAGQLVMEAGRRIEAGSTYGSLQCRNADQTVDSMFILTGSVGNYLAICEFGDRGFDWSFAQAGTPTFYVCGSTANTTHWGSMTHDDTNFIFNWGTGLLDFAGASMGSATVTHDDYVEFQVNGVTKKFMTGS